MCSFWHDMRRLIGRAADRLILIADLFPFVSARVLVVNLLLNTTRCTYWRNPRPLNRLYRWRHNGTYPRWAHWFNIKCTGTNSTDLSVHAHTAAACGYGDHRQHPAR